METSLPYREGGSFLACVAGVCGGGPLFFSQFSRSPLPSPITPAYCGAVSVGSGNECLVFSTELIR